jgi:hypothetical protein
MGEVSHVLQIYRSFLPICTESCANSSALWLIFPYEYMQQKCVKKCVMKIIYSVEMKILQLEKLSDFTLRVLRFLRLGS